MDSTVIQRIIRCYWKKLHTNKKENLEEMPLESNPNCHKGKAQQLRNSPSESAHVSIHMYCTLFLLINTLPASLLSVFVEIFFWKVEGQNLNLCFPICDPGHSLAENPSPAPSHCKWRPLEIMSLWSFFFSKTPLYSGSSLISSKQSLRAVWEAVSLAEVLSMFTE